MIQLAIQFDGLLVRFGRVVPDALAMLERILNIDRRLKHGAHPVQFEFSVIRFAPTAWCPDLDREKALAGSAARAGVDVYFQPLEERSQVISSAADLNKTLRKNEEGATRIVLLSASAERVREAAVSGIEAFHVWESGALGERWLPYGEVPRMLEEMLRIPTARPMAPSVRHGALLSIDVGSETDARSHGLDAIRRDSNADWLTLAGVFILYTEDPDLEDQLVDERGFRRLSFDVKKGDLVIDTTGAAGAGDTLLASSGLVLRKRATEDSTRAPGSVIPWDEARRRVLPVRKRDRRRAISPAASDVLPRLQPLSEALQAALRSGVPDTMLSVFEALAAQLPADSAIDLITAAGKSTVLSWQAPYGGQECEDLAVIVHDIFSLANGSMADSADSLFELALSVVLERTFTSINPALASLHCVRADPTISVESILEKALLATERARIAVILQLRRLSVLRKTSARLRVTFSKQLEPDLADLRGKFPSAISAIVSQEAGTPASVQITGATSESPDSQAFESLLSIFGSLLA